MTPAQPSEPDRDDESTSDPAPTYQEIHDPQLQAAEADEDVPPADR